MKHHIFAWPGALSSLLGHRIANRSPAVLSAMALAISILGPVPARATDLTGLNIPQGRMPTWYPPTDEIPLDTSGWKVVPVPGVNPAANGSVDSNAINSAIAAAAERTVLTLPAGTFEIGDRSAIRFYDKKMVVLRGAGKGVTILRQNSRGANASCGNAGSGSIANMFILGSGRRTSTDWEGGFERGSNLIQVGSTAGFGAGEFVELYMPNPSGAPLDSPHKAGNFFAPIVRIQDVIDGKTLRIERPLRISYDFVTAGRKVYKLDLSSYVGVENLTMTATSPSSSNGGFHVCMGYSVYSWVTNVEFLKTYKSHLTINMSSRNLVMGSDFSGTQRFESSGAYAISLGSSTLDTMIHNNSIQSAHVALAVSKGAGGTMFTYNFDTNKNKSAAGDSAAGHYFRSSFSHGSYPRETLWEGNDVAGGIFLDAWWGRQGPRNTLFRNRTRDDYPSAAGLCGIDPVGGDVIADQTNYLLNVCGAYAPAYGLGNYDKGNHNSIDYPGIGHTNIWFEANRWTHTQNADQCVSSGKPYSCCSGAGTGVCRFGMILSPRSDTSCGTAPGDCPTTTKAPAWGLDSYGTNFEGKKPTSWFQGKSFTPSLVLGWSASNPPPGWCDESGPFGRSIGADVDDMTGADSALKLPAHRRISGLSCNGVDNTRPETPRLPDPPFLLP